MKTRLVFDTPNFEIPVENKSIAVPSIHFETEIDCTLEELVGMYELQKRIFAELPGLAKKFIEEVEAIEKERAAKQQETQESKESSVDKKKDTIEKTIEKPCLPAYQVNNDASYSKAPPLKPIQKKEYY